MGARPCTRRAPLVSPVMRSRSSFSQHCPRPSSSPTCCSQRCATCAARHAIGRRSARCCATMRQPYARPCWHAARRPMRPAVAPRFCLYWRGCRNRWRCWKWVRRLVCVSSPIDTATTMGHRDWRLGPRMHRYFLAAPAQRRRCLRRIRVSCGGLALTCIRWMSRMRRIAPGWKRWCGPSNPIVWIACARPSQWQDKIRLVSFRAIC